VERFIVLSFTAATALLVLQGALIVAMLCALGRIHLRISSDGKVLITDEGPRLHDSFPSFSLPDAQGRLVQIGPFYEQEMALFLISPGCGPCEQLLKAMTRVRNRLIYPVRFVMVIESSVSDAAAYQQRYRSHFEVLSDPDSTLRQRFGVERTPFGFLVDEQGFLRMKGVVNNLEQLEGLLRRKGRYIGALVWEDQAQPAIS